MCGGTPPSRPCPPPWTGLSPRVRGNLPDALRAEASTGSIPACAGEPPSAHRRDGFRWVYPRVCGGTVVIGFVRDARRGLSPRVRGNLRRGVGFPAIARSIPACAGEPCHLFPRQLPATVYPRVCGGTVLLSGTIHLRAGLSPRVRGNHRNPARPVNKQRSIPACAGEPDAEDFVDHPLTVYPRVCGGTWTAYTHPWPGWGLSPRVRGNLNDGLWCNRGDRSIPACAGEP